MDDGLLINCHKFVYILAVVLINTVHLANGYEYVISTEDGLGRTFDGIGAISGGGATLKLLLNYPKAEQSQVLDYLFKANWGASLHILKVEIGGDSQSSEGTESSHMHEAWDENYERGYEWWLMKEAKKRNPDIKLYGLPWGFPGWLADGEWWPFRYPNRTADYITRWIEGAKAVHGLDIDYIGIWNEKPYDTKYVKVLRETLNSRGLSKVKIVAADLIGFDSWDVVDDLEKDKALAEAVDIIGGHYTGTWTTDAAKQCGKPLWSSEDYSSSDTEEGGGCFARLINQNYVNGLMTSTIAWNLIYSYYSNLPYAGNGLMTAQQPWSGFYTAASPIWTSAHTTQFTAPGWVYLPHGKGVGQLKKGGSYVTLTSPDKNQYTIVIETMNTAVGQFCPRPPQTLYKVTPQNITLSLKGVLSKIEALYLWSTKLGLGQEPSHYFRYEGPIKVKGSQVMLHADINSVYTLTTVKSGHHGTFPHTPTSKPKPFPSPYSDDFESYPINGEAYNFAQQVGVFEIQPASNHGSQSHGKVMQQVMLNAPIYWCPLRQTVPVNLIGNYNWTDIELEVDILVPSQNGTTGAFVGARVDQGGCTTFFANGVFFFLHFDTGQLEISQDLAQTKSVSTARYDLWYDTWYRVGIVVRGSSVQASIDGQSVIDLVLSSPQSHQGFVALGTENFKHAQFDNFVVKSL